MHTHTQLKSSISVAVVALNEKMLLSRFYKTMSGTSRTTKPQPKKKYTPKHQQPKSNRANYISVLLACACNWAVLCCVSMDTCTLVVIRICDLIRTCNGINCISTSCQNLFLWTIYVGVAANVFPRRWCVVTILVHSKAYIHAWLHAISLALFHLHQFGLACMQCLNWPI